MKIFFAAALAATLCAGIATAQDLKPLNSDSEPDRMDWSDLEAKFGALPKLPEPARSWCTPTSGRCW